MRAAVLGHPVSHSLSPVLHRAAYAALGLDGWCYDAIDCTEERLPRFVGDLGPEWIGLSVTMPGKVAALEVATSATERARTVGAANTLVRTDAGWAADSTDVAGVTGALRSAAGFDGPVTGRAVVLGAGGTARSVLVALAELGISEVVLVVRDAGRAGMTVRCGEHLELGVTLLGWENSALAAACAAADLAVNTAPAVAVEPVATAVVAAPTVLDAAYHPWPTPLATAAAQSGSRLASGLDMLLHQAFGQVEQFTALPAPREAMRAALRAETGDEHLLPI